MKVLVTGATGFIGQALIKNLLFKSREVRGLVRKFSVELPLEVEQVAVGDLKDLTLLNSSGVLSCLLYTSPSPRDGLLSRMPSSA